jgi:acyl carrier protein
MHEQVVKLIIVHSGIAAGTPIEADTDLFAAGMKSFAAVQLMLALEEAFEVEFPEALLGQATFRSPGAIVEAVSRLRADAQPPKVPRSAQPKAETPPAKTARPVQAPAAADPRLQPFVRAGLLIETGVAGVYGKSAVYETVLSAMDALITRMGAGEPAEVVRFPPVLPLNQLEGNGYMENFPQLAGTVHVFCGGDEEHLHMLAQIRDGEDWTRGQQASGVALTPAACYPLYPMMAAQGPLPAGGRLFDVKSYCFRHEPSADPARMQLFRMREYVRAGTRDEALAFRNLWTERMSAMAERLGMKAEVAPANDPFFGRLGKITIDSQVQQQLKFELMIPIAGDEPRACISFNHHLDHMAGLWDIRLADGSRADTACIGIGLERLALALFSRHGMDPAAWPAGVRGVLWG